MFKRALEANHWMAIGLDNWNELETRDIPSTRVRKMRLVDKKVKSSRNEDSDESDSASIISEIDESLLEPVVDSASAPSDSDTEDFGSFVFCELCPGRKFLTGKDIESHQKSKMHLKREAEAALLAAQNKSEKKVTVEKRKKEKPLPVVTKSVSNRKARRAGLVDTRK